MCSRPDFVEQLAGKWVKAFILTQPLGQPECFRAKILGMGDILGV